MIVSPARTQEESLPCHNHTVMSSENQSEGTGTGLLGCVRSPWICNCPLQDAQSLLFSQQPMEQGSSVLSGSQALHVHQEFYDTNKSVILKIELKTQPVPWRKSSLQNIYYAETHSRRWWTVLILMVKSRKLTCHQQCMSLLPGPESHQQAETLQ